MNLRPDSGAPCETAMKPTAYATDCAHNPLVCLASKKLGSIPGRAPIPALSKCPACGYYAWNGIECFDCGYRGRQ